VLDEIGAGLAGEAVFVRLVRSCSHQALFAVSGGEGKRLTYRQPH
jgi:hypothetical protein